MGEKTTSEILKARIHSYRFARDLNVWKKLLGLAAALLIGVTSAGSVLAAGMEVEQMVVRWKGVHTKTVNNMADETDLLTSYNTLEITENDWFESTEDYETNAIPLQFSLSSPATRTLAPKYVINMEAQTMYGSQSTVLYKDRYVFLNVMSVNPSQYGVTLFLQGSGFESEHILMKTGSTVSIRVPRDGAYHLYMYNENRVPITMDLRVAY